MRRHLIDEIVYDNDVVSCQSFTIAFRYDFDCFCSSFVDWVKVKHIGPYTVRARNEYTNVSVKSKENEMECVCDDEENICVAE